MIITNRYSTYEEHTYLYQLVEITREGIADYVYYKQIENLRKHNDSLWHIHTQNAYQTVIIRNWNKLFGTDSEPTHYKKLLSIGNLTAYTNLPDQDVLKRELLTCAQMTEEQFNQYHNEMNNYRNRYATHTHHNPATDRVASHPNLNMAFETFKALHTLLFSTINRFPCLPNDEIKIPFGLPNLTTSELVQQYIDDLEHSPLKINK